MFPVALEFCVLCFQPAASFDELAICHKVNETPGGSPSNPFFVDIFRPFLAAPPLPTSIVLFFRVSFCFVPPFALPPALPVIRLRS